MKRVAFYTLGCKVNQYETNGMIQKFQEAGYEIVDFEDVADIYIVNTCTVTSISDKKSRMFLRQAKRKNPESIVVACGCYVQVAKEEIEKIPIDAPCIIASGPLTSQKLADDIKKFTGEEHLHFFDAIAPIVEKDSINFDKAFYASRYDKGEASYINCPMNKEEYTQFIEELKKALSEMKR